MNLIIHIDGGARGNPGPAAAGVLICDADTGRPLHEAGYFLGTATNNVAEYQGLLHALELTCKMSASDVTLYSDSELMVKQLVGEYRVKSPDLKPLFELAQRRLLKLDAWQIKHVRREKNQRADELANLAMDARRDVIVRSATGEKATASASSTPAAAAPADPASVGWTAELTGARSRCRVGQSTGNAYPFGPTTPEGFCVHAAAALFADAPTDWPRQKRTATVRCKLCSQSIKVERLT